MRITNPTKIDVVLHKCGITTPLYKKYVESIQFELDRQFYLYHLRREILLMPDYAPVSIIQYDNFYMELLYYYNQSHDLEKAMHEVFVEFINK